MQARRLQSIIPACCNSVARTWETPTRVCSLLLAVASTPRRRLVCLQPGEHDSSKTSIIGVVGMLSSSLICRCQDFSGRSCGTNNFTFSDEYTLSSWAVGFTNVTLGTSDAVLVHAQQSHRLRWSLGTRRPLDRLDAREAFVPLSGRRVELTAPVFVVVPSGTLFSVACQSLCRRRGRRVNLFFCRATPCTWTSTCNELQALHLGFLALARSSLPFCTLFVSSARTSRSGAATLVGAPPNDGGVMLHVAVGSHETVAAKQVCTTRRPRALQVCSVFFDDLLGSHKPSCSHTPCLSNVCWQVRG